MKDLLQTIDLSYKEEEEEEGAGQTCLFFFWRIFFFLLSEVWALHGSLLGLLR